MIMNKRPKFMLDIEEKSLEQIEKEAAIIKEKFKDVFDELAKH